MSLFDAMFARHSVPHMEYHGDEQPVVYSDGKVNASFHAIVEPFKTVYRETNEGHRMQVKTSTVIFSRQVLAGYGGVDAPTLAARFDIDGEKWIVDTDNEDAIQATTGNYHKIAIKSASPMGRGYSGLEARS